MVWDARSGRLLSELEGHDGAVTSLTFDGKGKRLVSTSKDRTARIWSTRGWRSLDELSGHDHYVTSAAFHPDGSRLAHGFVRQDRSTLGRPDARDRCTAHTSRPRPNRSVQLGRWSARYGNERRGGRGGERGSHLAERQAGGSRGLEGHFQAALSQPPHTRQFFTAILRGRRTGFRCTGRMDLHSQHEPQRGFPMQSRHTFKNLFTHNSSRRALPRCRATLAIALAATALSQDSRAQNLIGLDSGGPAPEVVLSHQIDPVACNVALSCAPTDAGGGNIGNRSGPPFGAPTPGGGVAYADLSKNLWLTPGPTLHVQQSGCAHLDQWNVFNVLPLAFAAHPAALRSWTGLSVSERQGKLFFTDFGYIAEVDIPAIGSGGAGVPMPVSGLSFMAAPAPLAMPLTGVDYDPVDDTLWVIDSQYNVVHMDRPSAGGAVLGGFNAQALFGAMPVNWAEGIAINPCANPPGLPRGVLRITDFSNQLLTVSTNGVALNSCFIGGLPRPIVGLDLRMPPAPTTYCTAKPGLSCGTPSIGASGLSSAQASSGFVIKASPARAQKLGILLYNTAPASPAIPFAGGVLCVAPGGVRRAGPVNSGGTPGACDGAFSIDMNAFAFGGGGGFVPAGYLSVCGTRVFAQFWGRDSLMTGSFLSDAIEYVVGL